MTNPFDDYATIPTGTLLLTSLASCPLGTVHSPLGGQLHPDEHVYQSLLRPVRWNRWL